MTPPALQDYLHAQIPLSRAMAVQVISASPQFVQLLAPLAPNSNHHGTVFGGSASALATLAAWGLLHLSLQEAGLDVTVVIQKGSISYDLPITSQFIAQAQAPAPEPWRRFLAMLLRHGRARISLGALLFCKEIQVGAFTGEFVAVRQPLSTPC